MENKKPTKKIESKNEVTNVESTSESKVESTTISKKPVITGFFHAFLILLESLNTNNQGLFVIQDEAIEMGRPIPAIGLIANYIK